METTLPSERLFRLDDRVAVVTGGASGLGRAIAAGMASCGATVVITSRRPERESGELPSSIAATRVRVDVTSPESVDAMVRHVISLFGRIDILVNSAGIGARSAADQCSFELWQSALATNLTGTFLCCQAVGRTMLAADGGSIINIASIAGLVGLPGSVAYQASKGGVIQLTRSLAIEWAPHGVRVNALAPTQFETPLVRRQWEAEPDLRESFIARTPLSRIGHPSEIVGPAVFLASDASSMITGHILTVDGGFTAQ